ncbi:MAG TPA: hypothetical protein VIV64_03310 [Gammaproteobacteria bacterium]
MQFTLRAAGIATLASTALTAGVALAQEPQYDPNYEPPRTPWGDPDLQGTWPGTDYVGVPMERSEELGERNWLNEEEYQEEVARRERQAATDSAEFELEDAANTPGGAVGGPVSPPPHWLERGEPQYQASLIVDPPNGRFPARANPDEGGGNFGGFGTSRADSYLDRSNYDRCITRGIAGSILPVIYNNGNQIFQAPGYVAIRNEMIHETRIVPLDGRAHADDAIRMWMGDSRGYWDGNTLVIETRNLNDQTAIRGNGGGRGIDPNSLLTERLTRVADDVILYSLTVDDPTTWVEPWTLQFPWRLDNSYGMFEYACHEGNYAMFNILSGARAEEARAAAEAAQ